MAKVDWQSWVELGEHLPPRDAAASALVWTVIQSWLPASGRALRYYKKHRPELWRFAL
jgi:hypothetical protein